MTVGCHVQSGVGSYPKRHSFYLRFSCMLSNLTRSGRFLWSSPHNLRKDRSFLRHFESTGKTRANRGYPTWWGEYLCLLRHMGSPPEFYSSQDVDRKPSTLRRHLFLAYNRLRVWLRVPSDRPPAIKSNLKWLMCVIRGVRSTVKRGKWSLLRFIMDVPYLS
jgi:hypothetical protein